MEDEELSDSEYDEAAEKEEEQSDYDYSEKELPENSTRLSTYNQQKEIVGYTIVDQKMYQD
jgi:hypothetical protein